MDGKLTREYAASLIPRRSPNTHKGDFGKVLILAGSVNYSGAAVLAARSAVRGGAGLVYLSVPRTIYTIAAVGCLEAITIRREDGFYETLQKCNVCAVGPGLGISDDSKETVLALLKTCQVPLIIDADGINVIADNLKALDAADCPVVLTPHEGEFARLAPSLAENTGITKENRASLFAKAHKCTLVLKGHGTVIAYPDGSTLTNTAGNPGMAKGGSGDALTGLIAALAGQLPLKDAVALAVFVHSFAADILAKRISELSITAHDIIESYGEALFQLSIAKEQ
ncbi:MAG: NAD(P)H-hydrate dehydratase [Oscillospiraceae bacterium]|jgi:NAD(P)H-hydrate epimerase|nr:NAD(P)H-hydrate dehydratase [Oscillospiraceae bacterium]